MTWLKRFEHWRAVAAAMVAWLMGAMPAFAQSMSSSGRIPSFKEFPLAAAMASLLFLIVVIMMLYAIRHFIFTMNRLIGKQRHPYLDIAIARWPKK